MARPKVLTGKSERVEAWIPSEEDIALDSLAATTGLSRATLLRMFISTGIQAYTGILLDAAPAATAYSPARARP